MAQDDLYDEERAEEVVVGDFSDAAAIERLREEAQGQETRRATRKQRAVELTPRKVTASVWACFRLLAGREGDDDAVVGPAEASLRCLFCTSVIHTGGNSSNCLRHMRSDKHKEAWALVETAGRDGGVLNAVKAVKTILAAQTKRKENFFKVRSSYCVERARSRPGLYRKEAALVSWAVDKNVPFHAFTGDSWDRVKEATSISFAGEATLRAILDPMYSYVLRELRADLRRASAVSISFDLWTAVDASHYLGISYHWIDQNWRQRAHVLDLLQFQASATGELLAHILEERFDQHLPPADVVVVLAASVSDRGGNARLARDLVVSKEQSEHCVPHLLKTALDNLTEHKPKYSNTYWRDMALDMSSLVQLLTLFNNKPSNLAALHAALPEELKHLGLVFPNDTRWEGRLRMVQRALRLKEGLVSVCQEQLGSLQTTCGGPDDFLTAPYWARLDAYAACYGLVNGFSQKMQGDGALKSAVLVDYYELHALLLAPSDSNAFTATGAHFAGALDVCFKPIVETVNNTTKAALLDPRNYPRVLELMDASLVDQCWDALSDELASYHQDHALQVAQLAFSPLRGLVPKMDPSKAPEGEDPLLWCWARLFADANHQYLAVCVPLIQGILCIPASAAKCERIFSFTTRLINRLTSSLSCDTAEMKTIVKDALDKGFFDLDAFLEFIKSKGLGADVTARIAQLEKELREEMD